MALRGQETVLSPSGKARLSETGLNKYGDPSSASAGRPTRWKLPMFHPLSRWRLVYEVILFTSVIVTGFLIPVEVAWAPDLDEGWKIFFLTMDMYFLLDTILNFRLGYIVPYSSLRRDPGGLLPGATAVEMAPGKVAVRYLKTWFVPDLLGSLPYDLIGWNGDTKAGGVKLLSLFRILKVMRLNRLQRIFTWRPSDSMFAYMSLGFTTLWLFLFSHFAACVFYWVGRLQPPDPNGAWIYGQTILVDDVAIPVSEASPRQQYLTCIYYSIVTVTSVGFGDVHGGTTPAERAWAVVQVLAGTYVMGYVLAEITTLILAAHDRGRQSSLRTAALEDFFDAQEHMPAWLQRRIIEYYDRKWHSKEIEVLGEEIVNTMPRPLKLELSVGWWTAKVKPSVLLPHDRDFLRALLAHAEVHDIKPMQTIVEQGSIRGTGHLYVILSGIVVCTQRANEQYSRPHSKPTPRPSLDHTLSLGMSMRSGLTVSMLPIDLEAEFADDCTTSTPAGARNELFGGDHEAYQPPADGASGPGLQPIVNHLMAMKESAADSKVPSSGFMLTSARRSGRQDVGGPASKDSSSAPHNDALFPGMVQVMDASDRSLLSGVEAWRATLGNQPAPRVGAAGIDPVGRMASASDTSGGEVAGTGAAGKEPETDIKTWELAEGSVLGESVLQASFSSKVVREKGKRIRQRSLFTAHSQTAVRLSVIPLEDAVETILSFPALFQPLIHSVQCDNQTNDHEI